MKANKDAYLLGHIGICQTKDSSLFVDADVEEVLDAVWISGLVVLGVAHSETGRLLVAGQMGEVIV